MSTRTRFLSVLATATTVLCTLGSPAAAQAEGLDLSRLLTESPVHAALHAGTRTRGLSVSVGTFLILDTDLYQVRPKDGQSGGQGVSVGIGYGLLGLPRYDRVGTAVVADMEPLFGFGMTLAHESGSTRQALGTAVGLKITAGIAHVARTPLCLSVHAAALKGSSHSAGEVGIAAGLIFD